MSIAARPRLSTSPAKDCQSTDDAVGANLNGRVQVKSTKQSLRNVAEERSFAVAVDPLRTFAIAQTGQSTLV